MGARVYLVYLAGLALAAAVPLAALPQSPPSTPDNKTTSKAEYVDHAVSAIKQMQSWYDPNTGLWQGAWWNSANALTTLADFQSYFPDSVKNLTADVFPTTLSQGPTSLGYTGFLDDYYDDELWWALAWIAVYDVTVSTPGRQEKVNKNKVLTESRGTQSTSIPPRVSLKMPKQLGERHHAMVGYGEYLWTFYFLPG
jgi:hypothetical protein